MLGSLPLLLVLLQTGGAIAGPPAGPAPPDCNRLLAAEPPGAGVAMLCEAETAMRRAAAARPDERRPLWAAAADRYQRAANALGSTELRSYSLEVLVRLSDAAHLDDPAAAEHALRALAVVNVGTPAPLMRLAKFQEGREQFEAAEQTLFGARQQYPEALDLLRELSKFFARRVVAITGADRKGDSGAEPAPEPARYRPDCHQLSFDTPGSGLSDLCHADAEMQRAASAARGSDERKARLTSAAEHYRAAASRLREIDPRTYALEALASVYGPSYLNDLTAAETVIRQLIALSPGAAAPVIRLSSVQEQRKLVDIAESTLIGARQQFPDNMDVLRALARFYARLATNVAMAQSSAERQKEPPLVPGQPDAEGFYPIGGPLPPPRPLEKRATDYPADAKAVGLEGVVILEIWIDETGRVSNARVLRGIPMLEEVALAAVKEWRYEPVIVDGRAVPVRMVVTHNFTMK